MPAACTPPPETTVPPGGGVLEVVLVVLVVVLVVDEVDEVDEVLVVGPQGGRWHRCAAPVLAAIALPTPKHATRMTMAIVIDLDIGTQ
jgi:hypothetical protein